MTDNNTPMLFGVRKEWNEKETAPLTYFGREILTLWTGAFMSGYCGQAVELPKHNGYMVTLSSMGNTRKLRVDCESPRTDNNWMRVDEAINAAINKELFGIDPV